jgi:cytochrome c oxidase subunit II
MIVNRFFDRLWSLFFLLVPILGVAVFVWAMADAWPFRGHWLPENVNDHGGVIDNLFLFILVLTGIIFVGTGIVLFWFLWKYTASSNTEPVKFSHGSHTLEVVWSILPAATLLFIAIYQMNAWADAKMRRPTVMEGGQEVPQLPLVEVTGRQFEWRIRYAGEDGIIGTPDDVFTVNELHLPVNEDVVIAIKTEDVLHSFFLPNLRIKQDVVPGMKQFVWFRPNRAGRYDIVCAELCGWGHYKMRGELVLESRASFDAWLKETYEAQEQTTFEPAEPEED